MSTRPGAAPIHGCFLLVGLVLLVLVGAPAPGAALAPSDTTGVVRGQVVEQGTGRPLPGASIRVAAGPAGAMDRPPVTSDAQGRFVVQRLPSGTLELQVQLLGYETLRSPELRITPGRAATVTLELRQRALELEGVEVRVSRLARPDDAPLSTRRLTAEQVRRTAGGQTDISRTLLSLPGVLRGVDNRNDLLVRGRGPGENLYVMDGIRIPRINHFETQGVGGGALGLLNVEFIQDTDFHAGAFPAGTPSSGPSGRWTTGTASFSWGWGASTNSISWPPAQTTPRDRRWRTGCWTTTSGATRRGSSGTTSGAGASSAPPSPGPWSGFASPGRARIRRRPSSPAPPWGRAGRWPPRRSTATSPMPAGPVDPRRSPWPSVARSASPPGPPGSSSRVRCGPPKTPGANSPGAQASGWMATSGSRRASPPAPGPPWPWR